MKNKSYSKPEKSNNQYTWNYIYRIALKNKKKLIKAHLIAVLATLASVPVPLFMPLLVDEVLLHNPGNITSNINLIIPTEWQNPIIYIAIILGISLLLRLLAIIFNIIQGRQFSSLSKDVIFRIRKDLINRLQSISMSEYETLGTGAVVTHMVTDLGTLDTFIGSTISRLLVASLTVLGTAIILLWMHWQLGLFILLLNPLVIYFAKKIGSRIKDLKEKENTAFSIFQQSLTETLEAIHQIRASNREKYYCQQLIDSAQIVRDRSIAFSWKSDAASRLSFLIFLFGFDIFRATAMLMVLYSDLSVGEMLAVFGYLWFMMAPVQEILGIQNAFFFRQRGVKPIEQTLLIKARTSLSRTYQPF